MYSHLAENCLPINLLSTATFVYKNMHSNILSSIQFTDVSSRRGRSSKHNELQIPSTITNFGHKSNTSFGVKIFNSLPTDLTKLQHPVAFKWALKCHIRNESFMSSCFSNEYLKKYFWFMKSPLIHLKWNATKMDQKIRK